MFNFILGALLFSLSAGSSTELLLPVDQAILNEYNPELSWASPTAMESVRVQIATDVSFSNVIADSEIHSFVQRFVPADDLEPGDYWWRVAGKCKDAQSWGSWTLHRKFTIVHNPTITIPSGSSFQNVQTTIRDAGNNKRILFESGTYTFTLDDVGTNVNYVINLENRTNVVIDGNGSTIIFDGRITHCGFVSISGLAGCTNITIKNFDVRRNYPMALPLEVLSVDTNEGSFICQRVSDKYPLPAADTFQYAADSGWILDKDTQKIKFGTPLTLFVDPLTSGVFEETKWKYFIAEYRSGHTNYIHNMRAGDVYLKDKKYGNGAREIYALRAHNLTLYNINSFNNSINMNVVAEKCAKVNVIRCSFLKDQYLGVVTDTIHLMDIRGGAWLENNTVQYNGDDGFAILPLIRASAFSRINDSEIEVSWLDDVQVGDVLHFFEDNSAFSYVTESAVKGVEKIGAVLRIELSDAVITTNITSYSNYSLAAPGTMIRGNTLEGCRGDGFHITLNGAIIENNRLIDIGERAMTLTPTKGGGSYSQNVMIRNNVFNNLLRSDTTGTVGTFLMINNGTLGRTLHNNIHFVNNSCFGYQSCAVEIGEARNVTVQSNRFSSGEYHDFADVDNDIVLINDSDNVFIRDNVFTEHRNRPVSSRLDLVNAAGWAADNPDFEDQFHINLWDVSKINHNEDGSTFLCGEDAPARSLTKVRLTGSGTMNGGNSTDKCTFANVTLTGNSELRIKVYGLGEPTKTDFAKGGLMIRESTNSNSKMVMLAVREYNGNYSLQHLSRTSTGGGLTANNTVSLAGFPVYLKLVRSGDSIISNYSYDEVIWIDMTTNNIPMSDVIQGGVAVTSQATGELTTLYGDELHIEYE